jgi:hypothetical protein
MLVGDSVAAALIVRADTLRIVFAPKIQLRADRVIE